MAGPPRNCRDCKAPIVWVKSMTRPGKRVALDPSPDPELGTVRRHQFSDADGPNSPYAETLTGDRLHAAQANNEQLWMLHRHTCTAHRDFNPRPAHVTLNLPTRRTHR